MADDRKYKLVYPADVIQRKLPKSIEEKPHWHFQKYLAKDTPEVFLANVPQGKVLNAYGSVISGDDVVLGDLSFEWFFTAQQHSSLFKLKLPEPKKLKGTTTSVATASGWNYYHWLLDVLPRLGILEKAGVDLNFIDWFIFNSGNAHYQTETLDWLGIPKNKRVFTQRGAHFQSDLLLAPSVPGVPSQTPKWVVDFLRKSFPAEPAAKRRKIYISRARSKYRRFTNGDDVRNFLLKRGFEKVFAEELSFREQVNLFASAEAIVAPHGAGLANLIFCQPNTPIVEIFSPEYVNGCFWALANHVDLNYWYLLGQGARPPEFHDPHNVEKDIEVDLAQLEKTLEKAGIGL